MRFLPASTPLFMGSAAEQILKAATLFVPKSMPLKASGYLKDATAFELGPFRITPHLTDHSAYDSYALTVAAGGKTLFYSGDLRAHGRKAVLFNRFLSRAPRNIDALLLEGSSIGRLDVAARFPTEEDLEESLVEAARRTEGALLVCASSQNIDRVVTVFRAALQSKRVLVIDLYSAAVLAATGNKNVPQSDWGDVRLLVPHWQRVQVKRAGMFELLQKHSTNRIFPEQVAGLAKRAIFLFRPSMAADLERAGCLEGSRLIWSQWEGYLSDARMSRFVEWRQRLGIPMDVLHTSGHACISDLQRLAKTMQAKRVVPIHSFEPGRYPEFFDNVECRGDGERWSV